jgi:hypothetical protein
MLNNHTKTKLLEGKRKRKKQKQKTKNKNKLTKDKK